MRDALVVPTYGFVVEDQAHSGSHGTKERIRVAQKLIRDGIVAHNCIVPFPQNMMPNRKDRALLGDVTLGKNVADYVRSLPEFSQAIVEDSCTTMGTFDDTIETLEMIRRAVAQDNSTEAVHVHFVSDWSQLGRLWIIWNIACARTGFLAHWQASFYLVPSFRSTQEVWTHEPFLAYPKCLLLSARRLLCHS